MVLPVRLLVVSVLAAETLVTVLIAQRIGAFWSFVWFVSAVVLGMLVIRRAGVSALLALRRSDSRAGAVAGSTVLVLIAGVLLIVPGFLSDLVALLLLIPPVREQVRQLVVRRAARRFPGVRATFTTVRLADGSIVIPGEVVEETRDDPPEDEPPSDRPGLDPRG